MSSCVCGRIAATLLGLIGFWLLGCLLIPAGALAGSGGASVRIAIGEWPPYLGANEPGYGPVARIVEEVMDEAGMEVEYEFHSWQRALNLARYGERDGTAVWFHSRAREEDFHISEPVIRSRYVFFHRQELDFHWTEPEDLEEYRMGLTRGYDYGPMLEKVRQSGVLRVQTTSTDEQNLRKLLAGRIDLFPVDRQVGREMIRREFTEEQAEQLTSHPRPLRDGGLALLLSRKEPKNRERVREFNAALRKMHHEGRTGQILREALGEDTSLDKILP